MPKVTPHIFKASLTSLVLLCLGVWIALSVSNANAEPDDYDTNGKGILEKNEVVSVLVDYFQDKITKDEVLGVLILYFLNAPDPTPTPTTTSTPIPTATLIPTSTPVPEPTQTSTSSQEDVTAPEVVELTLGSAEVDMSGGAGTVVVKLKATDDISGIRSVEVYFESPTGAQSEQGSARDPLMGTSNEGVYAFRLTLPQYSETGTWRLKYVWIRDNVGNRREYRSAELTTLGLATSFEVVGQ